MAGKPVRHLPPPSTCTGRKLQLATELRLEPGTSVWCASVSRDVLTALSRAKGFSQLTEALERSDRLASAFREYCTTAQVGEVLTISGTEENDLYSEAKSPNAIPNIQSHELMLHHLTDMGKRQQ